MKFAYFSPFSILVLLLGTGCSGEGAATDGSESADSILEDSNGRSITSSKLDGAELSELSLDEAALFETEPKGFDTSPDTLDPDFPDGTASFETVMKGFDPPPDTLDPDLPDWDFDAVDVFDTPPDTLDPGSPNWPFDAVDSFDTPPEFLDPGPRIINVRNLSATSATCKSIGLSWQRPSSGDIGCGRISAYRVYRNGVFLEAMSGESSSCWTGTYQLSGNHQNRANNVDEGSTHNYEVRVVDDYGVERVTTQSVTHSPPLCATSPLTFRTNITLVTFSDVVEANCPSYPCMVEGDPQGVPFTRAEIERDVFLADGSPNHQVPFAWMVKKHAPDKNIQVEGLVTQWIVLRERSHYCPSPFGGPQCIGARAQIAFDARDFRGDFKEQPRHDVYYINGVGGGASAGGGGFILMAFPTTMPRFPVSTLLHEAGHGGFFEDISLPLVDHSRGLRCPGGALPLGPSLRDVSQNAQGVSGQCKAFSYADLTCRMGSGGMLSGYARWHFGFIDATQVVTVPFEQGAELSLEHMDQASSQGSSGDKLGIVALEPNSGDAAYVLEYRDDSILNTYPGASVDPSVLPEGVYIHLKLRSTGDLGAGYPGTSNPATPYGDTMTLMLSRARPGVPINSDVGYAQSQWQPIVLNEVTPSYCDPYRRVRLTLREVTQEGGVDSARVDVERDVDCP